MENLTVPNVPDDVVAKLRRRAERHARRLEDELRAILADAATSEVDRAGAIERINAVREGLARQGKRFEDSTPLIREDRER